MREHGASVAMPIECKGHFRSSSITYYFSLRQLLAHSDAAITVGGDGTIIHAAKYAAQTDTPLIGVNVGRLGFAADVETEEIDSLARLITGDYSVENRLLLDIEVIKDGVSRHYLAVNDAVVAHGQLSKIIVFNTHRLHGIFAFRGRPDTFAADALYSNDSRMSALAVLTFCGV